MPELPEVHNFKLYFDAAATGQTIAGVKVHDDYIIRNLPGPAFADALTSRRIVDSLRRGKYLFANLDNGHALLLHFGMTGDLNLYQDEVDRHKFERFALYFADGNILGFDDPRKFARILYLDDRDAYIAEIKLGPDALDITLEEWLATVRGRKTTIKGVLLNQSILGRRRQPLRRRDLLPHPHPPRRARQRADRRAALRAPRRDGGRDDLRYRKCALL